MLARDFSIPPAQVNKLTVADFAALTDAIDAETRSAGSRAARDGR